MIMQERLQTASFIIGFQRKRYPSLDSHDYVI